MKIIPFFMRKLESLDFGRLLQFQTIEIALHKKLPASSLARFKMSFF